MKHFLNPLRESPAGSFRRRDARVAWPTAIAAVLAVSAFACSEDAPIGPVFMGGSGGQANGNGGTTAGATVVAGTSSTPTAGMPAATSGSGGMAGSSSGGSSAGTGGSSAGTGGGSSGGSSGGSGGSGGSGAGGEEGWVALFNGKDLTGWTPGPMGAALFAVDSTAGEPAIHVYPSDTQKDGDNLGQASLRTNESFSSYVLHVEYKWGSKRFADRTGKARDNGICFHVVLPLPNNTEWPTSIEFQLGSQDWPGDWVSGNIFMLVNKTRATWPYAMTTSNNQTQPAYSPTSTTKKTIGANGSYEKALSIPPNQNKGGGQAVTTAATEWNVVELTVRGSTEASYKVNGVVVNGLTDMKYDTGGGTLMPLDRGPIAIQAEFAETYFRNIKIKVLP